MNEVPNDGLIRLLGPFNIEKLFLTSPKALAEILAQKPYETVKPPLARAFIKSIMGDGILHAEGEDHRVRPSIPMQE